MAWLNRNIGCIEIFYDTGKLHRKTMLNRNIGCIEIKMWFLPTR